MWTKVLHKFTLLNYKYHIAFALILRVLVITYGHYHDSHHSVAFTDVDYKVFTDAARYVWNGTSPYNRHTYRYTPLIAMLLIPNLLLHNGFGKILFCFFDMIVALCIRLIVKHSSREFEIYRLKIKAFNLHRKIRSKKTDCDRNENEIAGNVAMLFWLYNPLTISISARGNCDSLAACLVLITIYFLQCKQSPFYAGLLHGLSIHIRLYPIMYSISFFMFLSSYKFYSINYNGDSEYKKAINSHQQNCNSEITTVHVPKKNRKTIFKLNYVYYLIPNFDQLKLIFGCLCSLGSITAIFYILYGKQFLFESLIYHFVRRDTRHNFSLYFYLQYLSADITFINIWQKILTIVPQFLLILVFSVRYGLNQLSLSFCVLLQTIVMVCYNTVVTSQYFVWILSVLPLCLWQINMPLKHSIILFILWIGAQGAWLLPAYLLEFQGQNTFLFIWIQSVSFFCANIIILGRLIKYFMFYKMEDKLS